MIQRIKHKKKIGFVASGGAAKAASFHMGVALALQRKGFVFRTGLKSQAPLPTDSGREIDVLVGSSAGSFACSLITSGLPLEEIYHSFLGHRNARFPQLSYSQMLNPNLLDTVFKFWHRLPKSLAMRGSQSLEAILQALFCANGLYSTEKLERYLRKEILPANQFSELDPEFYIVTTTLDNPGRLILGPRDLSHPKSANEFYHQETTYYTTVPISHASAASMSLPPVFRPYTLQTPDGEINCFDGEIRKTVSTHVAKDAGCDLVFVSYTHQPYKYREEVGSLMDYGMPAILCQALYQMIESRIMGYKDQHEMKKKVLAEVQQFFDAHDLPKHLRDELLAKLAQKLGFNPNVDYVFIHPTDREEELFFHDHFNLSSRSMEAIAEIGFRSAIRALKDYTFTFHDVREQQRAS